MIQKLDYIRDLGLFRDFGWGTLPEFKRYNLIYGWNYSGKTTLSRVLQALERDEVPSGFPGCDFQVSHEDGPPLGTRGTLLHPNIRVFNRAFIEHNFHSDMARANPIVVIGEENQRLKLRLLSLQSRRNSVARKRVELVNEAERLEESLKLRARDQARIVSELFGDRNYDRRNLLATVDRLPSDLATSVLTDASRDQLIEAWRRAGDYQSLTTLTCSTSKLLKSVARIPRVLVRTASYQAIERLQRNPKVEKWVREGWGLHSPGQTCEFCRSQITEERWSELEAHFSTEYQELHASIQSLADSISGEKCDVAYHDDAKLFPDLKDRYVSAKGDGIAAAAHTNELLAEMSQALQRKAQNLENVETLRIDLTSAKRLRDSVRRCNEVITLHNDKVVSVGDVRTSARLKIEEHYAADYVVTADYNNSMARISELRQRATKAAACVGRIEKAIAEVEEAIKNASIAPQKINDRLRILLADDNIEAVKVSETDFEFRRNGQRATDMSEGERTAVAFSYFLAKLGEGGDNLADLIIAIDDPICSFDSNHIFAVYSIIERDLSAARQLFVLTHNSDFFGLVKDWMMKLRRRDTSFYMVNRLLDAGLEWYADLIPLPRLLEKFKSDYLYSYHCLKTIDDDPSPSLESMCGIPNTIRRLLETYLGFRYPEAGAWHEKLDRLITSEITRGEIRKFTDEFSHSQHLRRAMTVPDYVSHCKRLVGEVLGGLRTKDPDHIASLDTELARS